MAVKVLGLYALLQAIPHVMYIPVFFMGGGRTGWAEGMFYALPGALYLAAGVMFLFASDWIVTHNYGRFARRASANAGG